MAILVGGIDFLREQGIDVTFNGKSIKIYFVSSLIIEDILRLNSILGFVESFKGTNFRR